MDRSIDLDIKERAYAKLVEVARVRNNITYGEFGKHLGIKNIRSGLTAYLDAIYKDETSASRPDITLVVVRKDTELGQVRALGRIDPKNSDHVREYKHELERVHTYWASH